MLELGHKVMNASYGAAIRVLQDMLAYDVKRVSLLQTRAGAQYHECNIRELQDILVYDMDACESAACSRWGANS